MPVKYIEQDCKTILHKIDTKRLPFNYGVNPYRGCFHSCVYCFARYTHSYLDLNPESDFENIIIVKKNADRVLQRQLSNPKWKKEVVCLGSVCDPYQPIEKKYQLTRNMLQKFWRFKTPITIATKSDLIVRDKDILADMTQHVPLNVAMSIATLNEDLRKEIEPRVPSTLKRLKVINELREKGIVVGVLLMPVIPFINDSEEELEQLVKLIAENGIDFFIFGILYLIGASKKRFLDFIQKTHPELYDKFQLFYKLRSPPISYKNKIYNNLRKLRTKYSLNSSPNAIFLPKVNSQLTIDQWFSIEK